MSNWIQTVTGRKFYPLDPRIEELHIEDIAWALSNLCRFTGHTRRFYSVAQHSVHAAQCVAPYAARRALLHDASEAYLTDLARPVKHDPSLAGYRLAEQQLQDLIYARYCDSLDMVPTVVAAVEEADQRMLFTERAQLMAPMADAAWGMDTTHREPYNIILPPWDPRQAHERFLHLFYSLFPKERV